MTVETTNNRISHAGNGVTTAFSFPYYFFDDADIKAILVNDTTGAETLWVLSTNYTVSGAGDPSGGTITATTPPALGETLVLIRDVALTQGLDLVENDQLPAEEVEKAHDRSTMQIQQVASEVSRSAKLPDGFTGAFDATLPTPVADSTLIINSSGDAFAIGPTTTDIADAEANATNAAASAASAAASETNAAASAVDAANSAASIPADALSAANNLSDVANAATALDNLGINGSGGVIQAGDIDPSVELGGPSLGSRSVMRVNEQNIREDITVWENRSTNVTIDTGSDTINKGSDDGWANGDHISFDATALPTGISVATIYYVVGVTANTLQVSTTYGGSALNFTDTGTSVNIYKPINTSTVGDITIESGFTVDVPAGSTWVVI